MLCLHLTFSCSVPAETTDFLYFILVSVTASIETMLLTILAPWAPSAFSFKGLAILFIAYWTGWVAYTRLFHPLRKIPGPILATLSRTWMVWHTVKGDMEHT